jgi:hypothetical protein
MSYLRFLSVFALLKKEMLVMVQADPISSAV